MGRHTRAERLAAMEDDDTGDGLAWVPQPTPRARPNVCGAGTGGGELCWLPPGHEGAHDPDAPGQPTPRAPEPASRALAAELAKAHDRIAALEYLLRAVNRAPEPTAPDDLQREIAEAIYNSDPGSVPWAEAPTGDRADYLDNAAAVMDVLRQRGIVK